MTGDEILAQLWAERPFSSYLRALRFLRRIPVSLPYGEARVNDLGDVVVEWARGGLEMMVNFGTDTVAVYETRRNRTVYHAKLDEETFQRAYEQVFGKQGSDRRVRAAEVARTGL